LFFMVLYSPAAGCPGRAPSVIREHRGSNVGEAALDGRFFSRFREFHRVPPSPVKVWLGTSDKPAFQNRRAVLFDLDGTLVDSSGDLTETVSRIFEDCGLDAPDRSEVVRWVGDGAAVLLERAFASRQTAPPADVMERFRTHHDACLLLTTRPYDGIPELLERLARDRELAVVTNKPTEFAERVVEGTGLARWFRAVLGPERVPERKPSGRHVLAALELLGRPPREAVMVGDGPTDLRSGRAAGAATAGVLWGYRSREELEAEEPDALAGDVAGLGALLGADS
jgi:phosphoglycolate phosphatase